MTYMIIIFFLYIFPVYDQYNFILLNNELKYYNIDIYLNNISGLYARIIIRGGEKISDTMRTYIPSEVLIIYT